MGSDGWNYAFNSPDGRLVAYDALGHIWLRSLPNGTPRRLTRDEVAEFRRGGALRLDAGALASAGRQLRDGERHHHSRDQHINQWTVELVGENAQWLYTFGSPDQIRAV